MKNLNGLSSVLYMNFSLIRKGLFSLREQMRTTFVHLTYFDFVQKAVVLVGLVQELSFAHGMYNLGALGSIMRSSSFYWVITSMF